MRHGIYNVCADFVNRRRATSPVIYNFHVQSTIITNKIPFHKVHIGCGNGLDVELASGILTVLETRVLVSDVVSTLLSMLQ